jgi:hypothetical protein
MISTIADDWTNVVGQKETPASMAGSLVTPLSLEPVATTMQAQGIPLGTAMSILSVLGVGMSTYGPKTTYMTGTAEERANQIKHDLKNMSWDDPEKPAYSEFLNEDQLKQFRDRRQQKRQNVIFNATYGGDNEDELKTRDKNLEYLQAMKAEGVSHEQAQLLLVEHYRRPDKSGKLQTEHKAGDASQFDPSYPKKAKALAKLYGESDPDKAFLKFRGGESYKAFNARWLDDRQQRLAPE